MHGAGGGVTGGSALVCEGAGSFPARLQIERRAGGAAARGADRRLIVLPLVRGAANDRLVSQARAARPAQSDVATDRTRRNGGRARLDRRRAAVDRGHPVPWARPVMAAAWPRLSQPLLEAACGVVLHPLELLLELLVAILQLLDRAGELPQRAFQAVEADRPGRRDPACATLTCGLLLRLRALRRRRRG